MGNEGWRENAFLILYPSPPLSSSLIPASSIARNERDRTFGREFAREEIRSGEAVHIEGHRQAEEVEQCGCDVHDRAALRAAVLDGRPVREQESIRRALVRAAQIRVSKHSRQRSLQ